MKGHAWKAILLALLLAALIVAAWRLHLIEKLADLRQWGAGTGTWGLVVFALIYMIAAVLFLPGSVLSLAAGATFGLVRGTLAVSAGATLGAAATFLISRYLARDRVARWAAGNERFAALDAAVGKEGGIIVFLARLSPIIPYNLLNYLSGLTRVRFLPYLLASWVGMLPGTILYVYLGVAGSALAGAASGPGVGSTWDIIFIGVGVVATGLLTFWIARIARQALSRKAT